MSEAKSASHTPPLLSSSRILLRASCTCRLLFKIGRRGDEPADVDASADKESADERDGMPGTVNRLMSCFGSDRFLECFGRIESTAALRAFPSSGLRWMVLLILLGDAALSEVIQGKAMRTIQSFVPFPDSRDSLIVHCRRPLLRPHCIASTTITCRNLGGVSVRWIMYRRRSEGGSLA
jgi:hypothetical protein